MSDVSGGNMVFGSTPDENLAANLVRQKLSAIYSDEPTVLEEEKEIAAVGAHSKHQKFMADLMKSGKDLVQIQVEWHAYYQSLPDPEKHEVWQEFYQQHSRVDQKNTSSGLIPESTNEISNYSGYEPSELPTKSMADLHKKLLNKVSANGKLKAKHQIKSLVYSIAAASFVTGLLFFVTNNERFIAPFIQPTKTIAAAPIITDGSAVGPESKLIIPKINLEAPIVPDVSGITRMCSNKRWKMGLFTIRARQSLARRVILLFLVIHRQIYSIPANTSMFLSDSTN